MGLSVSPKWDAPRTDLIQTVNFGNPDDMVKFAGCVQAQSPIDSFVTPIPSDFAGYEDQIVMAAGPLSKVPASNFQQTAHCAPHIHFTYKVG